MPIELAIVAGLVCVVVGWLVGRRDQWREPFCYCRPNDPKHACLRSCWDGRRHRSAQHHRHYGLGSASDT